MKRSAFIVALALDLVGAAGALLIAVQHWQTIATPRPAPFPDDILDVSGRTVDSAPTAFALVALAGVVAILATRSSARRVVGAVLVLAGIGIAWRAIASSAAIGLTRARALVAGHHQTIDTASVTPHITTHSVWPWLSVLCAVLVMIAGVLTVWRGHRWPALSSRHERAGTTEREGVTADGEVNEPSAEDVQQERARAATTLWNALDRGDDPTR